MSGLAVRALIILAALAGGISTAAAQDLDEAAVRGDGEAALVYGATTFTDYFVLLKVDGEWKIANKVDTAAPTAPR